MALTRFKSVNDFVRVWFYWKNYAVLTFYIIVFLVMIFAYVYTPYYVTTAKILILPRTSEGVIISTGTDEARIAQVSPQDVNSEIELITNGDVIRETVMSFKREGKGLALSAPREAWYEKIITEIKYYIKTTLVYLKLVVPLSEFESKVNQLTNAIEVEPVAMSNIIVVELEAERPKAAATVLNRLLEVYINHHNEAFSKDEGADFYYEQAEKYRAKLKKAELQFKKFQLKWHIVDLKAQNEANISQLFELNKELKNIQISAYEIETKIHLLRINLEKGDIQITKDIRTIPSIVDLKKGLVPLYLQRSEILKRFTKESREYQNVDRQISILKNEIRNEIIKAKKTEELELQILRTREEAITVTIAEILKTADTLSEKELFLNDMRRQIKLLQKNYMLYASKTQDAVIYTDRKTRDLANVSIAEHASVPVRPEFPPRLLLLIVSVVLGFFAALGVPFLLEFLDTRIKDPYDVEYLTHLKVISSVPLVKY